MKIIECPRDAMQGIKDFIPTKDKVRFINSLLKVGFDTIDFGSFVSPKAIPQLSDTRQVLEGLSLNTKTKLLAIVANIRGAEDALVYKEIDYLGFPLSLSETFQQRNTKKSIATAFEEIKSIQEKVLKSERRLVVYLSMGFGNPYNDPYEADYIQEFVGKLASFGVNIISLADTVGMAQPESIALQLSKLISEFPEIEIGAHLHVTSQSAKQKIQAMLNSGCQRIDGAIGGYGGCPMATDDLTGNLNTLDLIDQIGQKPLNIDHESLVLSKQISDEIFTKYF
ncbi:MAG: hydroxymethylglutaryl-CoA lyase [Cyclobacteriaceae bacterium]